MNSMNDERFSKLAMKAIVRQTTAGEQAELDALLASEPGRNAEFERLRADVRLAKEALPLVNATEATAGELPGYARGRLQAKVRQTYGAKKVPEGGGAKASLWNWRWALGLVAAAAVIVLVLNGPRTGSPTVVVQLAMLDLAGPSRGADTNEVTMLRQAWQGASLDSFSQATASEAWEKDWPKNSKGSAAKIIYDRSAGEVRVAVLRDGQLLKKTIASDKSVSEALRLAVDFVSETTKK